MNQTFILETERLILRRYKDDDLMALFEYLQILMSRMNL
jgi:hypothetical protein